MTETPEKTKAVWPLWEKGVLAVILLVAAAMRLWNITQNGYGNTYYSAAVRSMLKSWHNFFFASFDPGGFITVDKPPVALWVQTISAKLLGYSGLSLLLPQALAGIASVALLYYLVRRTYGGVPALMAACVLAVTPICIATDRDNNLDSLLVFTLLLAAWAILRAAETGRLRLLIAGAVLVGVAFNIKMMEAFLAVPTFALLYLLSAPGTWGRKVLQLGVSGAVLVAVSLSWAVAVDLTPASQRPYVGGTQNNSMLNLILAYNGVGRVLGGSGNMPGGGPGGPGGPGGGMPPGVPMMGGMPSGGGNMPMMPPGGMGGPPPGMGGPGGPGGPGGLAFGGQAGFFRLANQAMAGQISWLLPLALLGWMAAALQTRWRLPLDRQAQGLVLWGGWLATFGIVFSLAKGIIHQYYLVALAPALAALVGIGMMALWEEYRREEGVRWLLPASLILTAVWEARILSDYPTWSRVLTPLLLGGALLGALGMVGLPLLKVDRRGRLLLSLGAAGLGLLGLLISPTAWAVTPLLAKTNGALPSAGPDAMNGHSGPGMGEMETAGNDKLVEYLRAHRSKERYLLITGSVHSASGIIIHAGEPVAAAGGFIGSDPALPVERFAKMVETGEARFVLMTPMDGNRPGGNSETFQWVREHGKLVDPALWKSEGSAQRQSDDRLMASNSGDPAGFGPPMGGFPGGPGGMEGMMQLYDCAPNKQQVHR